MVLAISTDLLVFLIVLAAVVVIAVIAFFIYLYLRPKLKVDDKPTEEQIADEEVKRVLQPIEDEKLANEVKNYKDEDDD